MSDEYYWYCLVCKRRLKPEERVGRGARMVCCHCFSPKVQHYQVGSPDEPKEDPPEPTAEEMRG